VLDGQSLTPSRQQRELYIYGSRPLNRFKPEKHPTLFASFLPPLVGSSLSTQHLFLFKKNFKLFLPVPVDTHKFKNVRAAALKRFALLGDLSE